jgi:hypothetical protein
MMFSGFIFGMFLLSKLVITVFDLVAAMLSGPMITLISLTWP